MTDTASGTATTQPQPGAKPSSDYVVLVKDGDAWVATETVAAKSADAAIRAVAGHNGTFVAVPARSWKPVKVTAKVETTLVVEDAS